MSNRTLQKFKSGSFFTVIPSAYIDFLGVKEGDKLNIAFENEKITISKKGFFDDVDKGLQLATNGLRKDLKIK